MRNETCIMRISLLREDFVMRYRDSYYDYGTFAIHIFYLHPIRVGVVLAVAQGAPQEVYGEKKVCHSH